MYHKVKLKRLSNLYSSICLLLILFAAPFNKINAQTFVLDSTYGAAGAISTYTDCGNSFLLSNNKLLVASGLTANFGIPSPTLGIKKYNDDGSIDSAFGNNGTGLFTPSNMNDRFNIFGITVQTDGKIIVVGQTYAIGSFAYYYDFFLFRFNLDGTTDINFGTNGLVKYSINSTDQYRERFNDVVVDDAGRIVVVGYTENDIDSKKNAVAMRLFSNGVLDSTFATNGILQLDIMDSDYFTKIKILNNSIFIAGNKTTSIDNLDIVILKISESNGSFDSTFGANGIISIDFVGTNDVFNNLFFISNNKIMIAGSCPSGMIFTQIDENGNLDSTFSDDGKNITSVSVPNHYPALIDNIMLLPDNKYLVFSSTKRNDNSTNNYDYVVVRINENTTLDATFAVNGVFVNVTTATSEYANSMHLQSDGKVLLLSQYWNSSLVYTGGVYRYLNAYPVNLNELSKDDNILSVFPNPVINVLIMRSNKEISKIEIYNLEGRKINTISSEFNLIDFNNIDQGIYFLKVYTENQSFTKKIVKQY